MKYIFLYLLACTALLCGCDKGEPLDTELFVTLQARMATVDELVFRGSVNGQPEKNFLQLSGRYLLNTDSTDLSLRLVLIPENTVIAARSIKPEVGTRNPHLLTIYQHRSGETPFLVWPPENEKLPPDSMTRMQFTTRDMSLPASIKLRFYKQGETKVSDSCMITRYAFSPFTNVYYGGNVEYEGLNGETGAVLFSRRNFSILLGSRSIGGISIYEAQKAALGEGLDFVTLF